jgi:hypothetical protein
MSWEIVVGTDEKSTSLYVKIDKFCKSKIFKLKHRERNKVKNNWL